MIELYQSRVELKRADVTKAVKARRIGDMPTTVYTRVIKELAFSVGAKWIFKAGDGVEV